MTDETICHCMEVSRSTIETAIREQGLTSVEQIQEATNAGTGCGGCVEELEAILKELNG
jgi:bacterioferritin-associated ferredoxin